MKKFIICMLTITSIILLAGCSFPGQRINVTNGTNSTKEAIESITKSNPTDNITTSGAVAENGRLIVFAKNKNNYAISLDIEVEFYDESGSIIGSGKDSLNGVGAKSDVAVEIYETPESFATYKIYADAVKENYKTFKDELEVVDNNNGENIVVQVKNNSSDSIDWISVSVVYYKGDTPVGISDSLESDTKPGRSANFNIYYAYTKDYDEVSFDSYKVFVNEAYSYNY